MIALDKALRLQAWLDGELDPAEAREMEAWVGQDPDAKVLADTLRSTTSVLSVHEPHYTVPESREFYWSKIARGIELEERRQAREETVRAANKVAWWRHWFVPAGALAALLLVVPMTRWLPGSPEQATLALEHEIDTPVADVDAFTFRSESERMTVVWVSFDTN